jgi:uncharacterized protein (DUF39 family)
MNTALMNASVAQGRTAVLTLHEICERGSEEGGTADCSVAVIAVAGSISGSAAMLTVPVADRGEFTRAAEITLNGVRGFPGPAPNERLGVVDTMVFTDHRAEAGSSSYDGAALILDLLSGKQLEVRCLSVEGSKYAKQVDLRSMEFARLYVYSVAIPIQPPSLWRAVAAFLEPGATVVLNGSPGIVIGTGSRHSAEAPQLSLAADLVDMDSRLMAPAVGERPRNVVAFAVPLRDPELKSQLIAWGRSDAGASLGEPSAKRAASDLKQMILDGTLVISDVAAPDGAS